MANDYFYGLEGTNFYKIYVTEMALHGARVSSQAYDRKTAQASMVHFGLLGALIGTFIAKKVVRSRAEQEAKYDALDAGSPPFREGHRNNFSIAGSDILGATVKPKPQGMKALLSSGAQLELQMAAGKKRRFFLVEDQDVNTVKNILSRPVPNTLIIS